MYSYYQSTSMKFDKQPNDSTHVNTHVYDSSSWRHNLGSTTHSMVEPRRQLYIARDQVFMPFSMIQFFFFWTIWSSNTVLKLFRKCNSGTHHFKKRIPHRSSNILYEREDIQMSEISYTRFGPHGSIQNLYTKKICTDFKTN